MKINEIKPVEIEDLVYAYPNRLRKDGKSLVITMKKELISGCGCIPPSKILCSQLMKLNGRLVIVTFLDGKNYAGGQVGEK